PGRPEPDEGLSGLDLPAPPEVVDLGRGERLDLGLGPLGVDGADDRLVPLEWPVRVVAAHDVDLADLRLDHPDDLLRGTLEGPLRSRLPGEVTEGAGEDAEIRRVDVAVEDEVHPVPGLPALDVVRHPPESEEVAGLETGEAVLEVETLPGSDLLP